jgi:Fe-S cluster assembly protein SufD
VSQFSPASARALVGPPWLAERRAAAAETFLSRPAPTEKDEVWRYSRIDRLDLDRYRPVAAPEGRPVGTVPAGLRELADALGPRSALVVTVDGSLVAVEDAVGHAAAVGPLAGRGDAGELLGSVITDPGDFVLLNDAFAAEPVVVDVPAGATVEHPVVVLHLVTPAAGTAGDGHRSHAVFTRTVVRLGAGATAGVVEVVLDTADGDLHRAAPSATTDLGPLVVPVTELVVADDAVLSYVSVQALGADAWQIAHQASAIGAGATLRSFAVALGGSYARLRTDSALVGPRGRSELRAAYLGRDDQMLDFRTLQDHAAPRTTSDLLFKGAVADHAHSVYSGLIRMKRGAVRSDARQTNHNLVLDEGAHADSVPNLDIEENDVKCSHGSTVGPVDEDQRYYLESRGVEPAAAGQLIVAGFFDDIAAQVPVAGVRPVITEALFRRLGVVVPLSLPELSGGGAS